MKPTSNTTTASVDGGFRKWNSPIPYLFGGLALMLGLIALALLILACSYRKSPSSSSLSSSSSSQSLSRSMARDPEEKATAKRLEAADDEPKIVVIMAGDENPTYLAKPVVSSSH